MRRFWVTSDTHFGHGKMIEYCGRPNDFERRILKSHAAIHHGDVLIHLGDVCIGKDSEMHDTWIRKIPCRKWLVRGNHDRKSKTFYLNNGWEFVTDSWLPYAHDGIDLTFSHVRMDDIPFGSLNIHGHSHDKGADDISHKLISLERLNYQPVKLEDLVNDHRRFLK